MTALSSGPDACGPSALTMTPRLRKFALTAHITSSVGWLGAVVAYLALAIAGLTAQDAQVMRSAYLAMELTGWFVIVPLSLASLLTGLVQSLGTEWGLFRYYWILVKFALTIGAVTILLLHMPAVSRMSGVTSEVVHAGGGVLVLLTATTLSVYKPWGRTRYGWRGSPMRHTGIGTESAADRALPAGSTWGMYILLGIIGVVLLLVVLHLSGGGHAGH
jgi:hypothetical protein